MDAVPSVESNETNNRTKTNMWKNVLLRSTCYAGDYHTRHKYQFSKLTKMRAKITTASLLWRHADAIPDCSITSDAWTEQDQFIYRDYRGREFR